MHCFDAECAERATKELRGLRMCVAHYIEALEHSAHLSFGQWGGRDQSIFGDGRVKQRLLELQRERGEENKKRIESR